MKSAIGPWLVSFLLIAPVVGLTCYLHRPPEVVTAGATPSEFSAARAFEHLKVLAATPHPVGTPSHNDVRDYLVAALRNLGLQPEIQLAERKLRNGETIQLQNIVARLPGSEATGRAVLLVAHYDSVSQSPGASDDGSGVVTLLEVLRALKARPPLKQDTLFLFSDGEELGLLGAKAFVDNPVMREVGFVMNFEARGSRGPVFMFETGDNNQWAIKQFGKVVPFPFANSIYEELYKLLPNDTDFTVFKNRGLPGFNFAYIDGVENYHSSNDNLGTIDLKSIQHQGSYGLALASHFGQSDLNQHTNGNAVFFDGLGRLFVSYPEAFVRPIALVLTLLLVGVVILGLKRRRLSLAWSAVGLLVFLISAAVSLFLTTLIAGGLNLVIHQSTMRQEIVPLLLGVVAINVALIIGLYHTGARYCSFDNLSAGTLIGWLLCTLAVSIYVPGASYIFQWSLLGGIVAFAVNLSFSSSRTNWLLPIISSCLGAAPGLVLFIWTGEGILQGVGLRWPFLISLSVVFLVGLLLPPLEFLGKPRVWPVPLVFVLVSFVSFVVALT